GSGVAGHAGEDGFIRIGDNSVQPVPFSSKTFIGGINGAVVGAAAVGVRVNAFNQLCTAVSSARFKKNIESMGKASESILALRPVTFHYKGDVNNTPAFGLIAEEVAKVNPDLILKDKEGKPYTVRYEDINVMLLNEFLKEHKAFVQEQRKNEEQQKEIDALKAELKEQAAQIQKVSARLERGKPAAQAVANNQYKQPSPISETAADPPRRFSGGGCSCTGFRSPLKPPLCSCVSFILRTSS